MDKIIYQDSSEELMRAVEANGEAMTTLIEMDAGVKSAASSMISRELLEKYRPEDDSKACIHLIAMGNSDQYGFNRNGDYFAGDVLEKNAHTFVKYGHVFREHRNKDPKKAIGSIKYAAYDPKGMQRVELIIHLDKDKAEKEYEMAKSGSALNFSMSCKVPNDRCSCCGNEAKSVAAYCEHLGSHMGQYMPEFKKYAFAYNDEPKFFDISVVKTPADRIARHLEYLFDEDGKSASYGSGVLVPSAVMAREEGVNLGSLFDIDERYVLDKLASAEDYVRNMASNSAMFYKDARAHNAYGVYPYSMLERMDRDEIDAARSVRPETLFREMAKKACIMSFPAFCQYITGEEDIADTPMFKRAALCLPDIFGTISRVLDAVAPCIGQFRAGSEFSAMHDPKRGDLIQKFMDGAERKFSMEEGPVKHRVMTIIIKSGASPADVRSGIEKAASGYDDADGGAVKLAAAYGQYQVGAVCDMRDILGADNVSDAVYDMVAGANSVMLYDVYGSGCQDAPGVR